MSVNLTQSVTNSANLPNVETANTKSKGQPEQAKTSSSSSASANVSLSSSARVLLASQDNDIDMNRVEAIKKAISSGELIIDTKKIANNLIKVTIREASE